MYDMNTSTILGVAGSEPSEPRLTSRIPCLRHHRNYGSPSPFRKHERLTFLPTWRPCNASPKAARQMRAFGSAARAAPCGWRVRITWSLAQSIETNPFTRRQGLCFRTRITYQKKAVIPRSPNPEPLKSIFCTLISHHRDPNKDEWDPY